MNPLKIKKNDEEEPFYENTLLQNFIFNHKDLTFDDEEKVLDEKKKVKDMEVVSFWSYPIEKFSPHREELFEKGLMVDVLFESLLNVHNSFEEVVKWKKEISYN